MKRFLTPFAILCIVFSSCSKKNTCEDVVCFNSGVCESGVCNCDAGFEGTNCETEQRLGFVNDYSVTESCNLGTFSYDVSMNAESVVPTELTISNFGDFGFSVTALVDGLSLEIEKQVHGGDTIWGAGLKADSIVNIQYYLITEEADSLTCDMICFP